VRNLTDEAGAVTDTYSTDAFGQLLSHQGTDPQPYLFAGEPYDPNVRMAYHRARWMEPGSGRFLGMDPFEGLEGLPLTLHRYLYASGDPVSATDPTGAISSLVYGVEVHAKIGLHFIQSSPNDRVSNRRINTVLGTKVSWVGWLRPDLVDRTTFEVYEIKAIGGVVPTGSFGYAEGYRQLQDYLLILNHQDPQNRPWHEGGSYVPPKTIALGPGAWAIVFPPVNGVILYDVASVPLTGGLLLAAGGLALSGAATAANAASAATTGLKMAASLLVGLFGF